jgi:Holliday junction resolvase-like predicted endonuclease
MALSGSQAEDAAARYLQRQGCSIVARNWRTRYCEIDIVAQRGTTLYLCEVKYRATSHQGQGMDYITPAKLRRMAFAAEIWMAQTSWQGEHSLCAIEVSGPDFRITYVAKDIAL